MSKMLRVWFTLLLVLVSALSQAIELEQVTLSDDDYLLVSIQLNNSSLSQSIDTYNNNGQLFIAIEPFFASLNLRYQLRKDSLTVWKSDEVTEYQLTTNLSEQSNNDLAWGDDGYYQYISQQALEELFSITFTLDIQKLRLAIETSDYQFPVTIIEQQNKQRFQNQAYAYRGSTSEAPQLPITVPDQYHLFTLPHGEIFSKLDMSDKRTTSSTSLQMVSDLFYHSARINLNKSTDNDLSGGINFSRYKTSPNDRILGAFDFYSFGDVSSYSSGSIIGAQAGVGLSMQRTPTYYRQGNTQINIEEQAPPGWEAELFLNNRFITSTTVSETGLLVFSDVDIYYGSNDFLIKIYGPFGEVVEYNKSYPLISNPLAQGDMAYGLYALDNERSLLNGDNPDRSFELNSLGGSFAYGISDRWQTGVSFQDFIRPFDQQHQQLVALKNYLNFPGLLFENEITLNADSDYVQKSSITGSLFGQGSYQLILESGDGLSLNSINSNNVSKYEQASATYFDYFYELPVRFRASYNNNNNVTSQTLSNDIFYNYKRLRFFHSAIFSRISQEFNGENIAVNNMFGSFGVSGSLFKDLRLSADIKYDPKKDDPILKSSRLTAQYKWEDPYFLLNHYFTFNYQPLAEPDNEWQLAYNLSYETTDYRLSLNSNYKANDEWSFGLNVNFFFGYDYYNNRPLTSSSFSGQSATLDIHTYLDRQLNGESDVLDYDLEGVAFYGNNDWQGLTTGKSGKILLPGAAVNAPFSFGGTWKSGSKTFNTDYVVYTHSGARIDINMPFYLTTEIASFVYRQVENGEIPVPQLTVELLDIDGNTIQTSTTDEDGYFEFTNIKPSQYTVSINQQSLHDKGMTTDVKGYKFNTPRIGGFTELPTIYVVQQQSADALSAEALQPMVLLDEDIELLVWDNDEQKRQNYFSLPSKQQVVASHTRESDHSTDASDTGVSTTEEVVADSEKQTIANMPTNQSTPNVNNNITSPRSSVNNLSLSQFYTLQLGAFVSRETAIDFAQNHSSGLGSQFNIVENTTKKWQTMYKVYFGKFSTKPEAENFALSNRLANNAYWVQQMNEAELEQLPKSYIEKDGEITLILDTDDNSADTNDSTAPIEGWVIQFYASKSPISPIEARQFATAGPIYMATKLHPNTNEVWYCLVSRGYASKEMALQSMQNANLKGWVNLGTIYRDAVAISQ